MFLKNFLYLKGFKCLLVRRCSKILACASGFIVGFVMCGRFIMVYLIGFVS